MKGMEMIERALKHLRTYAHWSWSDTFVLGVMCAVVYVASLLPDWLGYGS